MKNIFTEVFLILYSYNSLFGQYNNNTIITIVTLQLRGPHPKRCCSV